MVYYITLEVNYGKVKDTYYLWYDEDSKKPYPDNFGLAPQNNPAINEEVLDEINRDRFLYIEDDFNDSLSVHGNPLKFLEQYMPRAQGWNSGLTHVNKVKDIPYFKKAKEVV